MFITYKSYTKSESRLKAETTWMYAYWSGVHNRPRIKRSLHFTNTGLHTAKEMRETLRNGNKLYKNDPTSLYSEAYAITPWDWKRVEALAEWKMNRNEIYEQLFCEQYFPWIPRRRVAKALSA